VIREQVLKQIRHNLPDHKTSKLTAEEFEKHVFIRPKGNRLTYDGYRLLSTFATPYVFTHEDNFKTKHITALVVFKYPFYLSKKFFILFSEEDAMLLKLHGDVNSFLEHSNIFRD
jgi:hypothetical protein